MTLARTLLWFHLLGMSVWIGGTITVGAIVPALRRSGASREQLRA
nr:copper-binding protein [Actinomycetota bacterium]NIS32340.1 copper-binding protein [Actinomycetota bacterium]NIU18815.1 copper-binding protein [Actinomycetota bacterium]NIU67372.1 copper-binding protein [Actinomycetota bacterium]NIV87869.1 copper-binding protein [Actinomycetota bacterium]